MAKYSHGVCMRLISSLRSELIEPKTGRDFLTLHRGAAFWRPWGKLLTASFRGLRTASDLLYSLCELSKRNCRDCGCSKNEKMHLEGIIFVLEDAIRVAEKLSHNASLTTNMKQSFSDTFITRKYTARARLFPSFELHSLLSRFPVQTP